MFAWVSGTLNNSIEIGITLLLLFLDSPSQPSQIMGSLQSLNMDALLRHTFIPDYSVKSVTEVIYIVIKRNLYFAAKRATLMERSAQKLDPTTEAIDDEMEKVIKIVENIFIVYH